MYRNLTLIAIALFALYLEPRGLFAQACCSAGTPLLGSLELPATREGTWQFALSYDYNLLKDVVSGSRLLSENSRQRTVHSVLWETSYGITPLFSVSLLATAVQQERVVEVGETSAATLRTRGIGDAILLFKYALVPLTLPEQYEVTIGGGTKIPLGASTLGSQGVLIAADMQPGTGAWDGILWAYASQGFLPEIPLTLFLTASHRFTGTNDRYRSEEQGYKFGNETTLTAGAGYRTNELIDYSLLMRFRHVEPDQFGGVAIPNAGGTWLSVLLGMNVRMFDAITARFSLHVPLYRDLIGTQLTTTYRGTISLFYAIQR